VAGVVHRPGEGDHLFGGRIVIKADFEELCVTESLFDRARPGAESHLHRRHADTFYVLEGKLAFLVDREEHLLGPGSCVCAPAGVVHAFRSTAPARFLNVHTPDAGFAGNLRELDRGGPGGFDSLDAPIGSGLPGSEAVLRGPAEGERVETGRHAATIRIDRDELSLIEIELEAGAEGPLPYALEQSVEASYVLEGEAVLAIDGEKLPLVAGSFVAVPPGVDRAFSGGTSRSRVLAFLAPGCVPRWLVGEA
jgi:quercetin dioxygenase-like cupin family protein